MTLREAYKQWSQQEKNYTFFTKTKIVFGKVWSHLPFHLECTEYTESKLKEALSKSSDIYEDKVKASSVMIQVLSFGLSLSTPIYQINQLVSKPDDKPTIKKKSQNIFKPLIYKDKPLPTPEEQPKEKKKRTSVGSGRIGKPVYQIKGNGEEVRWSSVKEAANSLGYKTDSIYKAISANRKFEGCYWTYGYNQPIEKEELKSAGINEKLISASNKKETLPELIQQLKVIIKKLENL